MKFQKLITGLCIIGLTIILGCAAVRDGVIPAYIPEEIIYLGDLK